MRHWVLGVLTGIRLRLAFLVVRLLPLASTKADALGMRIYLALLNSDDVARAKKQLYVAVSLIANYEPHRYARLKADLRGILVYAFARDPRARYNRSTGFCELSPCLALTDDVVTIASSIVHEGTHARLRQVGKRDPADRLRIERLCLAQQVAFLERLPGMSERAAEIRAVRERLSVEDYTDAAVWADLLGE